MMSQRNVDLVLGLRLAHDGDLVRRVRDDGMWSEWCREAGDLFHPRLATTVRLLGEERAYAGIDGFRSFWLDWLEPWESYRIEIEQARDCGDRTLVVVRDFGRRPGATEEVAARQASVWTVEADRIARVDFYADPDDAAAAAEEGRPGPG